MRSIIGRKLVVGCVAMALAASSLAGCSSSKLGASAFGSNDLGVAEISDLGGYTAERALTEARAHFRNKDYGYSAALYKRVVELSPRNAEGYVGLGASYDRLRRFDLSDRVYASLLDLSGATVQYYNNVGYSYMLRGNLRDALASFRKAKTLDPDNRIVANNMRILASVSSA